MIRLTTYKLIFTFLICLLCGAAAKTFACDCPRLTTEQAFDKSSAVFSGKVTDFEYRKGIPNWSMDEQAKETGRVIDYETLVVKMRVQQWWKGEVPSEIYLLTSTTKNADGTSMRSSCDYTFSKDETYLIFATKYNTQKANEYSTSDCMRTRRSAEADEDLKILGGGQEPLESKDKPTVNSQNLTFSFLPRSFL